MSEDKKPTRKITLEPASASVRVEFGGTVVADSAKALILREGSLPPVFYIPRADVRWEAMQATEHHTYCPYKGTASYWSVSAGGKTAENAVWAYPEAIDEVADIRDCVAFYWNRMDGWRLGERELTTPEF